MFKKTRQSFIIQSTRTFIKSTFFIGGISASLLFVSCSGKTSEEIKPIALSEMSSDTLWSIWNNTNENEKHRLNALLEMAQSVKKINRDSTLALANIAHQFAVNIKDTNHIVDAINAKIDVYCRKPGTNHIVDSLLAKSIQLAQHANYQKGHADALHTNALRFQIQSDLDRAIILYQESIDIRKGINDKEGMAKSYNNLGNIYTYLGEYDLGIEKYQASLAIKKELGNQQGVAKTYHNIGSTYKNLGNYPKALEYFLNSLSIKENIGDKIGIAAACNGLGIVYAITEDHQKALEYLNRGLKIYLELNSKSNAAHIYDNIGNINMKMRDYSTAMQNANTALQLFNEIGNEADKAIALTTLGHIHWNMGKNEPNEASTYMKKALDFHKQSLEIATKYNNKTKIAQSYNDIGTIYSSLKKQDEAINWCNKGLRLSNVLGTLEDELIACRCLYAAHKTLGHNQKTKQYYEQYTSLKDSLYSKRNKEEIQRLEKAYKLENDPDSFSVNK